MKTLIPFIESFRDHNRRPMTIIFHEEGVCQKNYDELTKDVHHLSCGLRKKGVKQSDTVVLFAPNGYEWIVACLAVIKAGAIAVPVDINACVRERGPPSSINSSSDGEPRRVGDDSVQSSVEGSSTKSSAKGLASHTQR